MQESKYIKSVRKFDNWWWWMVVER